MACAHIHWPGGAGFICGVKVRVTCVYCGRRPGTQLCDGPAPAGAERKTCDKAMCKPCVQQMGAAVGETDYCHQHKPEAP
jgi:hypothetical protein